MSKAEKGRTSDRADAVMGMGVQLPRLGSVLLPLNGAGRMVCRNLELTQVLLPNGLPSITLPFSNHQDIRCEAWS